MRIILVGAGVVGSHLAERLSLEGHDISVIDASPELVRRIDERLDVLAIPGDASIPSVLARAGAADADLVIAVTDRDNTNIVVSLLARKLGARKVVVRLRNPELSAPDSPLTREEMGADFVINPIATTADLLERLIGNPGAFDAAEFADGELLLWGYEVSPQSALAGLALRDLRERLQGSLRALIVAISRPDGELVIPGGGDELRAGDRIYVFIQRRALEEFRALVHPEDEPVRRVVIDGCTRLGIEVAQRIEARIRSVVLIDRDRERAEEASVAVSRALVLHGDAVDPGFLRENNLAATDYYLALSEDDQTNLMHALLMRKLGVRRVVVQAQEPAYLPILDTLDIGVVVTPRLLTVNAILRHIRRGRVLQVSQIGETGAEAREYLVGAGSPLVGRRIRDLRLPRGVLVGAIQRLEEVLIPSGDTAIGAEDHIVIFALPAAIGAVEKLFARHGGSEGTRKEER
jgi:trk system potassium uptake protein TrkA